MERIQYISRARADLDYDELLELMQEVEASNAEHEIGGMLVYESGYFYQVMEGEEARIAPLMQRISEDPRHHDICLLERNAAICFREYPAESTLCQILEPGGDPYQKLFAKLLPQLHASRHALKRYTQPTIDHWLSQGIDPLEVEPAHKNRYVLFSDVAGFSKLCQLAPARLMMEIVDCFFNTCTKIFMDHHGEVNKFIGDSVMGYFPEEAADQALGAGVAILREIQNLRHIALDGSPLQLLHVGVGIDFGEVYEGNIGSYKKREYALQGQVVNSAFYIESLTRELECNLIISESVRQRLRREWPLRPLGSHPPQPGLLPVALYTLEDPLCLDTPPHQFKQSIPDTLAQVLAAREKGQYPALPEVQDQ